MGGRRRARVVGYVAPEGGAAHAFRAAEKKYKRYQGVKTDLSDVIDFRDMDNNTDENKQRLFPIEGRTFRGKTIYGVTGHDGFLVIPQAVEVEEQVAWVRHCVRDYMFARTNITDAPSKGSVVVPVSPWSPEGLERLHWATLGAHFEWTSRTYVPGSGGEGAGCPSELIGLAQEAYEAIGAPFSTDNGVAGTVNFYMLSRQMCGHIDDAEGDLSLPLVSLSLGHSCVYLLGSDTYDTVPTALLLRSGDLVIMSGPSRRSVHGVPRILEDTFPAELRARIQARPDDDIPANVRDYACDVRFNVNVRTGVFSTAA